MKTNLKGLSGIKGFLLLHGEKIAIAVVGLLALWFVYSSLSLPRLENRYQANNLQQEINQTNRMVQESQWPDPEDEPELASEVRVARPIAKSVSMRVEPQAYAIESAGFSAVIPPTLRRTDPELLNAVAVRAIGGSGLFAFVDEEIRRQQELKQRALEEERARKAEEQARRQQEQSEQGRGRRGRELQGEFGFAEVDPAHPNRRMVEGVTRPAGIPLQGGERIERAYWACVVAKVPIREQLKLYQDAFENARGYDPANDFPQYVGYRVQRAEVVRGKPLDWKYIGMYDAQRKSIAAGQPIEQVVNIEGVNKLMEIAAKDWAGQAIEPVDPRYLDPVLTLPLPPLVGRDFGADATHPDIPLAINAPPIEEELEPLADEQPTTERPFNPDDPLAAFRVDPAQQPFAGQRPGRFGAGLGREFPGAGRGGFGRPFGGEFGGPRGYMGSEMMMPGPGGYGGERGMAGGSRSVLPRGVDFLLLRFFDYTVEPGKKYKYRVQLALRDPNYGVEDRALDATVLDRKRSTARLVEEWSEPSPTVGIPVAGTVHLAEAKPPSGRVYNDEPTVKLWVEKFDIDTAEGTAVHVAKEKEVRRGYVLNLVEKNMEYTGDGDRWIDTYDLYKLHTGVTVLDVDGGERLNRDMAAPARVLVMDASGELTIRKEVNDRPQVDYLRVVFAPPDKRRGNDPGMFRGEMPFPGAPGMFRGRGER